MNPKQTKGLLAECGFFVFMYMCLCVHTAYVCVHLPSAALNDPKQDKQFRKWMGGWRAHSSARQISLGFLINKVIGDNGAIRAWLYS